MIRLDIREIRQSFPNFRAALLVADGIAISLARPPAVDAIVAGAEAAAWERWGDTPASEIPELRAWREAYRAFGVKKTSYRSSAERLLRLLQKGERLPQVSNLVDLYNAVSLRTLFPIGADDLDGIEPPLAFRYARPGDSFVALGDAAQQNDPPKEGEVVYADTEKILCRRWNWYQDARSAIALVTSRAALTVQAIEPASAQNIEAVAGELARLVASHCGGKVSWAVADSDNPVADVA